VIAGPTGCGKTVWLSRLLKHRNELIDPPPQNIVWFYGAYQPLYDELARTCTDVKFVEDLPEKIDDYIKPEKINLIVIDDLMHETDKRIAKLFTRGSHHKNLSIILVLQNLFQQGKDLRTISLNAHYVVLFKNPRDASVVDHFARQVVPGRTRFLHDAYEDATSKPYGYLFFDFKPNGDERVRFRTNVMPEEEGERITSYTLKKRNA
jgi:hypothetical protein